jgi:hypothetical protein
MYAHVWCVYNVNNATSQQNPTTYNTRGSSCVRLQAVMIHRLVISLILEKNQRHIVKPMCHCYTLNPSSKQIDRCNHLFCEPRTITKQTVKNAFLSHPSSLDVGKTSSQPTDVIYILIRHLYRLPATIFFFFVTSDMTSISLFSLVTCKTKDSRISHMIPSYCPEVGVSLSWSRSGPKWRCMFVKRVMPVV